MLICEESNGRLSKQRYVTSRVGLLGNMKKLALGNAMGMKKRALGNAMGNINNLDT